MGIKHITEVSERDLEEAGVTQNEYATIKKLMNMDPEIFVEKNFMLSSPSPYIYTVDLSKYENSKIPQDCKEILFRPKKMRKIYEKYWLLASQMDQKDRLSTKEISKKRHDGHPRRLPKAQEEIDLVDKVCAAIDDFVERQRVEKKIEDQRRPSFQKQRELLKE